MYTLLSYFFFYLFTIAFRFVERQYKNSNFIRYFFFIINLQSCIAYFIIVCIIHLLCDEYLITFFFFFLLSLSINYTLDWQGWLFEFLMYTRVFNKFISFCCIEILGKKRARTWLKNLWIEFLDFWARKIRF